jgi:predicted RNA-binding Zn ribbon-like protein
MMTLRHGDLHDAAQRALDVVNAAPEDVASVLRAHGETDLTGLDAESSQLATVVAKLRDVLAMTDRDQAAAALNVLLARHGAVPQLVRHEGWDWHVHVDRIDDSWSNWLGSSAAMALALRLAARPGVPWGICADEACGRAFLDDGQGGGRRHCSSRCATRQRVRRHRASRRAGARMGACPN